MGIPSYFKHLVNSVKSIVSNQKPISHIDWLWMDFNCLIYHCLQRPGLRAYAGSYGSEEHKLWEKELLNEINNYCSEVVRQVDPAKGVFIAVDGVVPMAKIKQQRMRRFKSIWLKKYAGAGGSEQKASSSWDTNAITPGTEFMKKLRKSLEDLAKHKNSRKIKWRVSSSDESGEGEHKIISEWRTKKYSGNHAVYGLDADLIVLSLLTQQIVGRDFIQNVVLFREVIEGGHITRDEIGQEKYHWFSIDVLKDTLYNIIMGDGMGDGVGDGVSIDDKTVIMQYCCLMSILGNDFLPTSLGLKIKTDGHSYLLNLIREMLVDKKLKVVDSDGALSMEGLVYIFKKLSENEEKSIFRNIMRKNKNKEIIERGLQKGHGSSPKIGEDNWVNSEFVEESLLYEYTKEDENGNLVARKTMNNRWKNIYLKKWFPPGMTPPISANEYVRGIFWNWDYYCGRKIDTQWYYPWSLPPLWSWVFSAIQMRDREVGEVHEMSPMKPHEISSIRGARGAECLSHEQLAIVLPTESWHLIPKEHTHVRTFPERCPYFFPVDFEFFSCGKQFFWECEPEIQIPTLNELRNGGSVV